LAKVYQNSAAKKADEGDIETAISYFGFALAVGSEPESISIIRKNLAKAYTALGIQAAENKNYSDSIGLLNHACEVELNDITRRNLCIAYALAAKYHLDQDDYENAITLFEYTVDLGLIFPELLNDYAVALARAQRREEATLVFQRALKLDPDNEIIQHNLNLAKGGANVGLSIAEIEAEFYPLPPMQQQEYFIGA